MPDTRRYHWIISLQWDTNTASFDGSIDVAAGGTRNEVYQRVRTDVLQQARQETGDPAVLNAVTMFFDLQPDAL